MNTNTRNMNYGQTLVDWSSHYPLSIYAKGLILQIYHHQKRSLNPEYSLLIYKDDPVYQNSKELFETGLKELSNYNLICYNSSDEYFYISINPPYKWSSPDLNG